MKNEYPPCGYHIGVEEKINCVEDRVDKIEKKLDAMIYLILAVVCEVPLSVII